MSWLVLVRERETDRYVSFFTFFLFSFSESLKGEWTGKVAPTKLLGWRKFVDSQLTIWSVKVWLAVKLKSLLNFIRNQVILI